MRFVPRITLIIFVSFVGPQAHSCYPYFLYCVTTAPLPDPKSSLLKTLVSPGRVKLKFLFTKSSVAVKLSASVKFKLRPACPAVGVAGDFKIQTGLAVGWN